MPTFAAVRQLASFFKANPQAFVLLIVCLVLGLGTFLAVLFGVVSSKSTQATGDPTGAIRAPSHNAMLASPHSPVA